MKLIAQAPTQTLSLRFENQIERCLLGFSELTKPGLSEHTGQARLPSLSAKPGGPILRQQMRAAKCCRSRVVKTAHGVQVLFNPIVGKGLDEHNRAVFRQAFSDMLRSSHGVAHVVQTVKKTDQVKTFSGITHSTGHFEAHAGSDVYVSGMAPGAFDGFLMIIEAPEARLWNASAMRIVE